MLYAKDETEYGKTRDEHFVASANSSMFKSAVLETVIYSILAFFFTILITQAHMSNWALAFIVPVTVSICLILLKITEFRYCSYMNALTYGETREHDFCEALRKMTTRLCDCLEIETPKISSKGRHFKCMISPKQHSIIFGKPLAEYGTDGSAALVANEICLYVSLIKTPKASLNLLAYNFSSMSTLTALSIVVIGTVLSIFSPSVLSMATCCIVAWVIAASGKAIKLKMEDRRKDLLRIASDDSIIFEAVEDQVVFHQALIRQRKMNFATLALWVLPFIFALGVFAAWTI